MDAKTIDTYNLLAQEYDEDTIDFWDRFPHSFIDSFVSLAKGSVLDVGSGPGRDGLLLQSKGLQITCLDASSAMIELCTSRGLNSVIGDFNKLPFENESFDAVWAYTSLLHVPKSEAHTSLIEIKRVLKTGGVFGLGLIEGDQEMY
jgi:ubiquinone/menaquinone biosynthesis C-methylase UbiE